jgi:hypothetical protein
MCKKLHRHYFCRGKKAQMSRLSIRVRFSGMVLGMVAILTTLGTGQVKNEVLQASAVKAAKAPPQPGNIPSCSGASPGPSAAHAASPANPHPHFVTLSWNPVTPASNSPRDLIKGYVVYRSLVSHTYTETDRITAFPLAGTQCLDTTVESRKTYFYVVKSVTASGEKSSASVEIKAVVPFP